MHPMTIYVRMFTIECTYIQYDRLWPLSNCLKTQLMLTVITVQQEEYTMQVSDYRHV